MKKLLPIYCFAAWTLSIASCKKDKKNNDPLLARWNWEYFGIDYDGNGILSEEEKMRGENLFITFKTNGRMLFEEASDKYPGTYERNGDQIRIDLNFFDEGPGTITTLDEHELVIDYNHDGMLLEYGFKK